jgi:hypothetical protein
MMRLRSVAAAAMMLIVLMLGVVAAYGDVYSVEVLLDRRYYVVGETVVAKGHITSDSPGGNITFVWRDPRGEELRRRTVGVNGEGWGFDRLVLDGSFRVGSGYQVLAVSGGRSAAAYFDVRGSPYVRLRVEANAKVPVYVDRKMIGWTNITYVGNVSDTVVVEVPEVVGSCVFRGWENASKGAEVRLVLDQDRILRARYENVSVPRLGRSVWEAVSEAVVRFRLWVVVGVMAALGVIVYAVLWWRDRWEYWY